MTKEKPDSGKRARGVQVKIERLEQLLSQETKLMHEMRDERDKAEKALAASEQRIKELECRIPFEKRFSNPKNEFGEMAHIGNGMKVANLSQHEWELMKAYKNQALSELRDFIGKMEVKESTKASRVRKRRRYYV